MTTKVEVTAYHGVPVEVDGMEPKSGTVLWTQRLEPGERREFHAHAGQHIGVRELGPQDIPEVKAAE